MENLKKTILCVDDERLVLISLKAQLKKNLGDEYMIEIAENAEDGLLIIDEMVRDGHELPLIISDQIMPGMKGDEFLIKVHHILPASRSIMLTGQANADAVGNALNHARLYRYISKPWDEIDFLMSVSAALDSYYKEKTIEFQNDELEKLVSQLQKYNESLEQVVLTRTAQINKQNEELLNQQVQLKEMNKTKDKLFAVIGHDLKNSLAALLSITGSLYQDYDDLAETDKIEGIQRIHKASLEMNQLLEHLLDWVRLQTGRTTFVPEIFDLFQMAEEMISFIRTASERKQLRINQSITCKALVNADRNMISTVMRNLLINAIKYSPRGAEIHIQCNTIHQHLDGFYQQIIIEDHGIGMEPEKIKNLMQSIGISSSPGTENEQGTGLGLIICRDMLQMNGGELSIESIPGQGSRFIFILPGK